MSTLRDALIALIIMFAMFVVLPAHAKPLVVGEATEDVYNVIGCDTEDQMWKLLSYIENDQLKEGFESLRQPDGTLGCGFTQSRIFIIKKLATVRVKGESVTLFEYVAETYPAILVGITTFPIREVTGVRI